MSIREHVQKEFARRRATNWRYSLRAFAQSMRVSHAVIRGVLGGRARVTAPTIRRIGIRLGLTEMEIAAACRRETEARLITAIRGAHVRPDMRYLAMSTGLPVDEVNRGVFDLLRSGRLLMRNAGEWAARTLDMGGAS
jgi:hypothetical protein